MFSSSLPTFPPRIALTLEIRHLALYLCQLNLIIAMLCEAPIVPPLPVPSANSRFTVCSVMAPRMDEATHQCTERRTTWCHETRTERPRQKKKKKKARMTKNADDICVSCFSAHCPTVHCAFQLRAYVHLRRCARRPILTATHVTRRVSRDVDEHTPRDYVHARIAAI